MTIKYLNSSGGAVDSWTHGMRKWTRMLRKTAVSHTAAHLNVQSWFEAILTFVLLQSFSPPGSWSQIYLLSPMQACAKFFRHPPEKAEKAFYVHVSEIILNKLRIRLLCIHGPEELGSDPLHGTVSHETPPKGD